MYEPGEDGHGCGRRHGPGQVIPAPETEPDTTQQGATYEHQEQQSPRQAQLREHPHGITVRLQHLDGRVSMLVEVVFVVLGSRTTNTTSTSIETLPSRCCSRTVIPCGCSRSW